MGVMNETLLQQQKDKTRVHLKHFNVNSQYK